LTDDAIIREQLLFFSEKKAGCLFAAAAARDPGRYGWTHCVLDAPTTEQIDTELASAVIEDRTTTLSLIFPTVQSPEELGELITVLENCRNLSLQQRERLGDFVCLGFRAKVASLLSYVTGFANLDFLPATRRAPFTEITVRVKPRPKYEFVFKEAPAGILHLADMDMVGMHRDKLWELWHNSFIQTETMLGEKPDLRSAARTTFSLPLDLYTS
jgi:hypothetical protein